MSTYTIKSQDNVGNIYMEEVKAQAPGDALAFFLLNNPFKLVLEMKEGGGDDEQA